MVLINFDVRCFDKVFSNDNTYYRCKIRCDCIQGIKTFYYEKVMPVNEPLSFTNEELLNLFECNPYDVEELKYEIEK